MQKVSSDIALQIVDIEMKWNKAIIANDVDEIAKYMADDWVIIGTEEGIKTKEEFLGGLNSGDLKHTEMEFETQLVQVHGDTAVVTAKGTSAGTWQGIPYSFYEWSISTYIKEPECWVCINTAVMPAKKSS